MQEQKGFLGALFDFSFSEFVTIKLIKILYILGVIFSAIVAIIVFVSGFNISIGGGIIFLIFITNNFFTICNLDKSLVGDYYCYL